MRFTIALSTLLFITLVVLAAQAHVLEKETGRHGDAQAVLDELELADSGLGRDILKARAGLLKNYDVLNRESDRIRHALERLHVHAAGDSEMTERLGRLRKVAQRNEDQVEIFKSQNSLLANSLTYFWHTSDRHIMDAPDGETTPAVVALASAMQRLTMDATQASVEEADRRLQRVALCCDHPASIRNLIVHSRILIHLLPATDATLSQIHPIASLPEFESVRTLMKEQRTRTESRSAHLRFLLLGLSLLMLFTLVYLAVLLKHRADALRRHSAFGRTMIAVSARFLGGDKASLNHDIGASLEQLAAWVGADEGYFAYSPHPSQLQAWPRGIGCEVRRTLQSAFDFLASAGTQSEVVLLSSPTAKASASASPLERSETGDWLCIQRKTQEGIDAMLCFVRRDGPFFDKYGDFNLLGTALDAFTGAVERRTLEDGALRLERRLERARRMETVGVMASGISHNFNNIVGAIQGNAEAAYAAIPAGLPAQHNLLEICRAAERARDLIDGILSFGRSQRGIMRAVDIGNLITESVSLLAASLPSGVRLSFDGHRENRLVRGNAGQLQQVVFNLVQNAANAMSSQGTVVIGLTFHEAIELQDARTSAIGQRDFLRISITDHGIGMAADTIERIFEPFFTTRSEGTGLGLATVKQIVVEHEGSIEVDSRVGEGTTFSIWLPALPAHDRADSTASPVMDGAILVLGDEPVRVTRDEDTLAALGHEPVGYLRLEAAVSAVAHDPERFGAFLIHLSNVGKAIDAAHALHSVAPETPIVVATATDSLDAGPASASGVAEIIGSPPQATEIAYAMERCGLMRAGYRR
ncbi:two-component system VirA-like sensor kinase [Pseudoxanthomonas putridarboris]|uniref:histidine kinase n=1 Tax=Pseudoxanthomonas putridarboris TaxID=752605 RepID=A0ABU9J4A4_9GAMM